MGTQRGRALCSASLIISPLCGCLSTEEVPFTRVSPPADAAPTAGAEGEMRGSAAASGAPDRLGTAEPRELDLAPPRDDMAASMDAREPEPGELSAAPSDVGPCDAAGLLLCESFEALTPGMFPSVEPWLPELAGCGSHRVEATGVSHSGVQALRAGADGYPECMLHAGLDLETPVYVRTWVRLDAGAASGNQYISLLEVGPRADRDDPELRIGVRSAGDSLCPSAPGVDVSVGGLSGGPSTECSGVVLEEERWYCFQARLSLERRQLEVSLQIDEQLAVEQAYAGLDASWNARELFVKLGRASYGGLAAGSVWHDDVALGSEPIPCGP